MVISDAPVGADLSGGPQAMWPDKPLAPESALVGRTQLAPDRPPLSPAQPRRHSHKPLAAATLTSPPGATATSYPPDTQPGTHIWESGGDACWKCAQPKLSNRPTLVRHQGCSVWVLTGDNVNEKALGAQGGELGWPLGESLGMEIPKHT